MADYKFPGTMYRERVSQPEHVSMNAAALVETIHNGKFHLLVLYAGNSRQLPRFQIDIDRASARIYAENYDFISQVARLLGEQNMLVVSDFPEEGELVSKRLVTRLAVRDASGTPVSIPPSLEEELIETGSPIH